MSARLRAAEGFVKRCLVVDHTVVRFASAKLRKDLGFALFTLQAAREPANQKEKLKNLEDGLREFAAAGWRKPKSTGEDAAAKLIARLRWEEPHKIRKPWSGDEHAARIEEWRVWGEHASSKCKINATGGGSKGAFTIECLFDAGEVRGWVGGIGRPVLG